MSLVIEAAVAKKNVHQIIIIVNLSFGFVN